MKSQKYYLSDPVARFLLDSMKLTPVSMALSLLIIIFVQVLISFSVDTTFQNSGKTVFFQDWGSWISYFVFPPILGGYYLWIVNVMDRLVQSISNNKVVQLSEKDISKVLTLYKNPWRVYTSLLSGFLGGTIFYISRSMISSWTHIGVIPRLSISVGVGIGGYLGAMTVLLLIVNVFALHSLMKDKELNLIPLHPDHCGGLRSLSEYSLKTAYLIAIAGLGIGLLEYRLIIQDLLQELWYLHLAIPLYVIVAIISFFAPLNSTHLAMKSAKNKLLADIAEQFQVDYGNAQKSIIEKSDNLKVGIKKIQQLQTLYNLTTSFPVWPFDTDTIRRFVVSITTPLVPIIIGITMKLMERLITP